MENNKGDINQNVTKIDNHSDLPIFSKQLDFFTFETHIRNTMLSMLEPLKKK